MELIAMLLMFSLGFLVGNYATILEAKELLKTKYIVKKRPFKETNDIIYDSIEDYLKSIKVKNAGNYKNITNELSEIEPKGTVSSQEWNPISIKNVKKPTNKEKFQFTFGDEIAAIEKFNEMYNKQF